MDGDATRPTLEWISANAQRLETPCYVYDLSLLRRRAGRVIEAFPGASLLYSLKANSHRSVVEALSVEAVGFEVSSPREVEIAGSMSAADVFYTGVAKSRDWIAHALRHGVRWFNGESPSDVRRLSDLASAAEAVVDVALRINPESLDLATPLATSGPRSRFGMSPEAIRAEGLFGTELPGIRVNGVHAFYGSQVGSHADLASVMGTTSEVLRTWLPDVGAKIDRVSIGLGLPAPYDGAPDVDVRDLSASFALEAERLRQVTSNPELAIFLEMGRYIVAPAGVFVTRVVDKKQSRGIQWLLVDGGMQSFYRPIMMRERHSITALPLAHGHRGRERVSIGGRCMTSEDVYAHDLELPRCEEGDLIVLHEAGAYGHSMSLTGFLGMDPPREYAIDP